MTDLDSQMATFPIPLSPLPLSGEVKGWEGGGVCMDGQPAPVHGKPNQKIKYKIRLNQTRGGMNNRNRARLAFLASSPCDFLIQSLLAIKGEHARLRACVVSLVHV